MAVNQRIISSRFPYIPVRVQLGRRTFNVEALLDTGFDGAIILPSALVANGAPVERYVRVVLADSSRVLAATYVGTLRIGGMPPFRARIIALGDEPIIGLTATNRYYVGLDHGRQIIIEP